MLLYRRFPKQSSVHPVYRLPSLNLAIAPAQRIGHGHSVLASERISTCPRPAYLQRWHDCYRQMLPAAASLSVQSNLANAFMNRGADAHCAGLIA